jgi:hypothetical protein
MNSSISRQNLTAASNYLATAVLKVRPAKFDAALEILAGAVNAITELHKHDSERPVSHAEARAAHRAWKQAVQAVAL